MLDMCGRVRTAAGGYSSIGPGFFALVCALVVACGTGRECSVARITFSACELTPGGPQHFTVCVTNAAFISEAEQHLADGTRRVPCFELRDGTGCDPQWTWSVDPATPIWVDVTADIYTECPNVVEANKAYWVGTLKRYCPWSAVVRSVTFE